MASQRRGPKPMKLPAIIACLEKYCGITVKEAELLKPTAAVLKRILENLTHDYAGFCRADQLPAIEDACKQFCSEPELHEEALATMVFHGAVVTFMQRAGMDDFALKDIYAPEPQRTLQVLTSAICYARYKKQHERQFLQGSREVMEPLFAQTKALQDESSEMDSAILQWNERRNAEQPQIEAVLTDIKALASKASHFHNQRRRIEEENESLQEAVNALEEKVNQEKQLIVSSKQEAVLLNRQIVESPDRLQGSVEELAKEIAKIEELRVQMKADILLKGQKKGQILKAARKVEKVKQLMTMADTELHNQKGRRTEARSLEEQLEVLKRQIESKNAQQQADLQTVSQSAEKVKQLMVETKSREAAIQRELDEKHMEKHRVLQREAEFKALKADKENKMKELQAMDEVVARRHHDKKVLREKLVQELLTAVNDRNQQILAEASKPAANLPAAAFTCRRALSTEN